MTGNRSIQKSTRMNSNGTDTMEHSHIPPVKGLHKMIRSSGYQAEDCILEYIDNSLDAGAKEIEVLLFARSSEESNIESICIVDKGGKGMNSEELMHGLTIAFTRNHSAEDIGMYGMGLKSASLNLGNELLVVSKQASSPTFVGARVDFLEQERKNDYKPTHTSQNAQADLFSHLQSDIRRELVTYVGTQKSATVIQMTRLHLELASTPCESFRTILLSKLRLSYSFDRLRDISMKVKIITETVNEQVVPRVDPFYLSEASKLRKDPITIQLYAIEPNNPKEAIRILERSTSRRLYKKGGKTKTYTNGTPERPIFYDLASDALRVVENPFETPIPNCKAPIPFTMTLVFTKKETFDAEDENLRKKGIWFRRGPRMVAHGLTLGIHGISAHGHHNQMRACVTYPPAMDKLMGAKYNKQINPKQGPLKDAIIKIWKTVTSVWVDEKEEERKKPKPAVQPTAVVEEESKSSEEDQSTGSTNGGEEAAEGSVQTYFDTEDGAEETENEPTPDPPRILIDKDRLILRIENVDVASVCGHGKNSALRPFLERILEKRGIEKVRELIEGMNTILSS